MVTSTGGTKMTEPGKRVGAIMSVENGVVKFFGYGTYIGSDKCIICQIVEG